MTPTIEEVKRVAEECGIIEVDQCRSGFYLLHAEPEELQAFAQHYIEVGRKDTASITLEPLLRIRHAIQHRDGVNIITLDDIYEEATAAIVAYAESNAICNNTGE